MTRRLLALVLTLGILAMAPGPAAAQETDKKLKAAFVLLWTIDDQGWTSQHYRGIQYLQDIMGDKIEVAYTEKVQAPDAERVFRSYASQGYDIIFGTSPEHLEALIRVAQDFPNIKFEHCSGFETSVNIGSYSARMYQAEYLAGFMAGLMGFKNVGTVATQPEPEVILGINAFTLGQVKGLKDAGVEFDKSKVNTVVWLNAQRDAAKEAAMAEALAAQGHDLIRQMADTPDSSLTACAQDVPAIGYGSDTAKYGADCVLVSSLFNWGPYYLNTVSMVMNGTWKVRQYWGGIEDNCVGLSAFHPSVSEEIQLKVLAERDKLQAGHDNIFTGPIYSQNDDTIYKEGIRPSDGDLLQMRVLVKAVSGEIPDLSHDN